MKTYQNITLLLLVVCIFFGCEQSDNRQGENGKESFLLEKPRTVITTDGEVDDVDSFIRMLLYANELDIVGLVYSSSQWHYKGDGQGTTFTSEMPSTAERYGERTELRWPGTDWMETLIGKYGEVHENLSKHADGYPDPDKLMDLIKVGNIDFEGEMEKDTDGSDLIKSLLLDNNDTPVFLQVWGGTNTIARALKSIEDEYKETGDWDDIYQKVSTKAIIYTVLDQDATYTKYVAPNWPNIKVIYNSDQFWCFAYPWPQRVPEELQQYLSGNFFSEHILNNGPLMAEYYTWGDGREILNDPEHDHGQTEAMEKQERNRYDFISEGDSPAYFFLLDVGLRSLEDPSFGGWGGRFIQSTSNPNRWEDGENVTDHNFYTGQQDATFPQTRWIEAIQNDFAARAAWCVKDFDEANHAPKVSISHDLNLKGKVGETIELKGKASDPDEDDLSYQWWHYMEAGTFQGVVQIQNSETTDASFVIPDEGSVGDTIHLIFQVSDGGNPKLTRYQRVIVEVVEE